jgi:hypothetical protein
MTFEFRPNGLGRIVAHVTRSMCFAGALFRSREATAAYSLGREPKGFGANIP